MERAEDLQLLLKSNAEGCSPVKNSSVFSQSIGNIIKCT